MTSIVQESVDKPLTSLPQMLVGPMLRHVSEDCVALWCVTRDDLPLEVTLFGREGTTVYSKTEHKSVRVGEHAVIQWLTVYPSEALSDSKTYHYDVLMDNQSVMPAGLSYNAKGFEGLPAFEKKRDVKSMLHGSCRKAHFAARDGFYAADLHLNTSEERPALLMLSGDQAYMDDVAGPMVLAIADVIELLGLYGETFEQSAVADTDALLSSDLSLYHRTELLPDTEENERLQNKLFGGVKKPIFTSASADNHLISLNEMLAMYFLIWSPTLWKSIDLGRMTSRLESAPFTDLDEEKKDLFYKELDVLQSFVADLPCCARVMANLPTYMMFDDHDVTDDWNLTRGWEEEAYGNPFSRRIIGNGILSYMLCQGWGNQPQATEEAFGELVDQLFNHHSPAQRFLDRSVQNALIDSVFEYGEWHYELDTFPKVVVLDTRTHRWRSESRAHKPSGLMDWEALSDMQQSVINQEAVILVSPAPIFGVKLIEVVQRIFTLMGKALMVDAENWMAHRGAANVLLNIFKHPKTPQKFTILSGDVHYSFVYDIRIRFRDQGPQLWQITHSGIKNQFPSGLLKTFDVLNRWLYGRYSPLNWLTKRRRMQVRPRIPQGQTDRLLNTTGMGYVEFNPEGEPSLIGVLVEDTKNAGQATLVGFDESDDLQV